MPSFFRDYEPRYMPQPPRQRQPAPHPGTVLSALIQSGSVLRNSLVDAGLDPTWLAEFLAGESDLLLPHDARATLLHRVTLLPVSYWIELQDRFYQRLAEEQLR